MMTLLSRVRELCKERKISQRRLERELGLGNGSVSKWDRSSPNSHTVAKLADFLEVSIDWLHGRTEHRHLFYATNIAESSAAYESTITFHEKDIMVTLHNMIEQLNGNTNDLTFAGKTLSPKSKELIKDNLTNSLNVFKLLTAKEQE